MIHLAALIPPVADEQPELGYKVNVLGTENVIKALEEFFKGTLWIVILKERRRKFHLLKN